MLSGTSTCTTPGRPSQLLRKALRISSGTRAKLETAVLHLAILPMTPLWSKHWYAPPRSGYMMPGRRALVTTSTRLPSPCSTTRPGRMLATPGPLLAMHTPSLPVSRA